MAKHIWISSPIEPAWLPMVRVLALCILWVWLTLPDTVFDLFVDYLLGNVAG